MYSDNKQQIVWIPLESGWRQINSMKIEDGRFASIGLRDELLPLEYNKADSYILPGLIDAHVHITENPLNIGRDNQSQYQCLFNIEAELDFPQVMRNLLLCLKSGITTIRDMGTMGYNPQRILDLIEEQRELGTPLPRVFTAGAFITRTGGHCIDRGIVVSDMSMLITTVRRLLAEGASFIKIMNDPIVFSLEELRAVREITQENSVSLAIHTYTDQAARLALEAGVDTIEHPGDYSDETIDRIKKSSTLVTSTFIAALDTVIDPVACRADELFLDADADVFRSWYKNCCECIPKLYHSGIKILCGTDAGFPGTDFDSITREICGLEMLGVPLSESIKGATTHAALALGYESLLGEVTENAWADYLLFDRNPLIGKNRFKNPKQVFCSGQAILGKVSK